MAEIDYRAKITHTEKTVEQLYKMQYYVYEKPFECSSVSVLFSPRL